MKLTKKSTILSDDHLHSIVSSIADCSPAGAL